MHVVNFLLDLKLPLSQQRQHGERIIPAAGLLHPCELIPSGEPRLNE